MKSSTKTLGEFVSRADLSCSLPWTVCVVTGLTDCGPGLRTGSWPALYSYCYCEEAVVKLSSAERKLVVRRGERRRGGLTGTKTSPPSGYLY